MEWVKSELLFECFKSMSEYVEENERTVTFVWR